MSEILDSYAGRKAHFMGDQRGFDAIPQMFVDKNVLKDSILFDQGAETIKYDIINDPNGIRAEVTTTGGCVYRCERVGPQCSGGHSQNDLINFEPGLDYDKATFNPLWLMITSSLLRV